MYLSIIFLQRVAERRLRQHYLPESKKLIQAWPISAFPLRIAVMPPSINQTQSFMLPLQQPENGKLI